MTKIKEIQQECTEMQATLRELSTLEDYQGADYSDVLTEIKWNHQMLKHRLLSLQQRRGRTQ